MQKFERIIQLYQEVKQLSSLRNKQSFEIRKKEKIKVIIYGKKVSEQDVGRIMKNIILYRKKNFLKCE